MSYQVLARKWRPQDFSQVVGQEHVLTALRNALEQERIHHAYLFTGTRGVGKTSLARIFAKSLNCEQGVSSNPCNQCQACTEISEGRFIDLIEVDAASRTKVEDTRELLDNVQYAPTRGRFKIYLIDEVHMLSGHSFNALLKTLEEPPPHVKFLLATTDPQKLPVTVLSRCLKFNLKNLVPEQITAQLAHILQAEQISFDEAALSPLALAADGSMRDALSLLDQAIAYGNKEIALEPVLTMLGHVGNQFLYELIDRVAAKDGPGLIQAIDELANTGPDYSHVLEQLLGLLHDIAIAQVVPEANHPQQHAADKIAAYAGSLSREDCQLYYQILLLGRRDLGLAPAPRLGFEMVMLRLLAFQPGSGAGAKPQTQTPVSQPATPTVQAPAAATNAAATTAPAKPVAVEQPKPPVAEAPVPLEPGVNIGDISWTELVDRMGLSAMTQVIAANCTLAQFEGNKVQLHIAPQHATMVNDRQCDRIAEALGKVLNQDIKVDIQTVNNNLDTPARQARAAEEAELNRASEALRADQTVQELEGAFNAQLIHDSIRSTKPAKQPAADKLSEE